MIWIFVRLRRCVLSTPKQEEQVRVSVTQYLRNLLAGRAERGRAATEGSDSHLYTADGSQAREAEPGGHVISRMSRRIVCKHTTFYSKIIMIIRLFFREHVNIHVTLPFFGFFYFFWKSAFFRAPEK